MLLGKRLQHLLRGPTFPSTLTDKSYSVAEVEFAKKRQLTEPGLCRKVAFCRCKWPRAFAWARSEFVYRPMHARPLGRADVRGRDTLLS